MKVDLWVQDARTLLNGSFEERKKLLAEYFTEYELTGSLVLPENIDSLPVEEQVAHYNANTNLDVALFLIDTSGHGNLRFCRMSLESEGERGVFAFKTPTIRMLFFAKNEQKIKDFFCAKTKLKQ